MPSLPYTVDRFNNVEIATDRGPTDPSQFGDALGHSMAGWRDAGHGLVWLQMPASLAKLIPVAVEAGFTFHHSGDNYLLLVRRLREDAFVPEYATHYIGAGGIVINEQRELLVVSEHHRRDRTRPYWKLPGGALHPREHIANAVVREVYEETGINAEFQALVCFRHWHGYRYGKSDIYFICRLKPLNSTIALLDGEIEAACWMPVDDYLADNDVSQFNRHIVRAGLESPGLRLDVLPGYDEQPEREFLFPPFVDFPQNPV
ncbi:MAG: NUDIX domain-containing protein [Caldilineaceae bacterium]|nr:NUDIX domain-containing protein [Caldilineaceae bacterium]